MKRLQLFGNPKVPIWLQGPMDWYEAVGVELAVTWGTVSQFQWEVRDMRWQRAQTIWLEGTHDDIRDRKRAVLAIARGILSERGGMNLTLASEIDNLWPMIPVDTISTRLANLVCIAYKDSPERIFNKDPEGNVDEDVGKGFDDLYDSLNVNEVMDEAYLAALFVNSVLILWDDEEEKFLVLTPEYFRIAADGIWVARRTGFTQAERFLYNTENRKDIAEGEIVFDVWTDKRHEVRSHDGRLYPDQCEDNPYGMFPGVLLKLNRSNDVYGAGITEAAELNAATNLLRLFALRTALFQGFSIPVLKNFTDTTGGKNNITLSPGKILTLQNTGSDPSTDPDFFYRSPEGRFPELDAFIQSKIKSFERNQDLPAYLVDESLTPPSGVALQVMEQPLKRKRESHRMSLRRTEKTLAKFIEKLAVTKFKRPALKVENFEINYADAAEFTEPASELEFD